MSHPTFRGEIVIRGLDAPAALSPGNLSSTSLPLTLATDQFASSNVNGIASNVLAYVALLAGSLLAKSPRMAEG